MTREIDPADPIVGFKRHPAAFAKRIVLAPAYPARELRVPLEPPAWDPSARFAPPGPSALFQPVLDMRMALAAPSMVDVIAAPPAPQSCVPPIAAEPAAAPVLVEPEPPPATLIDDDWVDLDEPPLAVEAAPPPNDWFEIAPPPRFAPLYSEPPPEEALWDSRPPRTPLRDRLAHPAWRRVALPVTAALVVLGVLAAAGYGVRSLFSSSITGVFNAPMMVVRAAVGGRLMVVSANAGEIVDPKSPLFSIHTLDAASPDRTVLAGVHGVVRSVETVPGADLIPGTPLARIHDCDRAFVTIPPAAKLKAGESVRIKLPDYPTLTGTVRPAAGIMEPPNTLVIGLTPNAIAGACPVGATGSVTPAAAG